MNIVIPEILAGGMGRTIQGVGAAISGLGTAATKLAGEVRQKYEDQQNLVEASRFENDMLLEKNKSFDDLSKHDDGTDQKFVGNIREADEQIGQKYISQASTDSVRNYLSKVHFASQKTNTLKAQEQQEKRLFNTSVENVKIFTDNAIRKSAPYADFDGGISSVDNYIAAQAGYFGASTGELSKSMKARFAENMVKTSLNDPVAAPVIMRKLSDDKEREKIFAHIPVENIDEIEKLMKSKGKDTLMQNAYSALYFKHSGNFTAMNEDLSQPQTQKDLGLGIEESSYVHSQIRAAQETKDKADNTKWNKNATQVFLNLSKVTPGHIDTMVSKGDLSYQLGEHFKQQKKELLTGGPSDPNSWYRAYMKIKDAAGDPDAMTKVRNEVFAMGGLNFTDKKDLIKLTESTEDKYEAGIKKKGMDFIKRAVMPSETMISAAKPAENTKFLEASMAFERGLEDAKKQGQKITPDFVEKFSKQIATQYSMTVYDQMDAATAAMRAAKEKRTGKKEQQPTKKIVGYKDGKPVYDLGNGKWQVGD